MSKSSLSLLGGLMPGILTLPIGTILQIPVSSKYISSFICTNLLKEFVIDGRATGEENLWWNPEDQRFYDRPGPGILPPLLAEELHDANHSLCSVSFVGFPTFSSSSKDPTAPGISASPSISEAPPPTESEVRTSIPHPNAYYCRRDNGWVILIWKSSNVPPPLAQSFLDTSNKKLPDLNRRIHNTSCVDPADTAFPRNKTHHFHKYERAVDSLKLPFPLRVDDWDQTKPRRQTSRDVDGLSEDEVEFLEGNESPNSAEGRLLDLYACCQCSFYVMASGVIPGVISKKQMEDLVREKTSHPIVGRTGEQTMILTVETILMCALFYLTSYSIISLVYSAMENRLWKGNSRCIKVQSSGFQNKVGWNPTM